jgi:hypothetical protein
MLSCIVAYDLWLPCATSSRADLGDGVAPLRPELPNGGQVGGESTHIGTARGRRHIR